MKRNFNLLSISCQCLMMLISGRAPQSYSSYILHSQHSTKTNQPLKPSSFTILNVEDTKTFQTEQLVFLGVLNQKRKKGHTHFQKNTPPTLSHYSSNFLINRLLQPNKLGFYTTVYSERWILCLYVYLIKGIVHQFWIYNIFFVPHRKKHFL